MEYKLFAVRVFVTDWERVGWAQMAPGECRRELLLAYVFCGGFGSSRSIREMKR